MLYWSKLKEVSLVQLRFGRPDVVHFDAQVTDDAGSHPCLLKCLAHDGHAGLFTGLNGPRRHLHTRDIERNIVVSEDQEITVVHDVRHNLPDQSTIRPSAHATFNGVIAAICSPARSSAQSSS